MSSTPSQERRFVQVVSRKELCMLVFSRSTEKTCCPKVVQKPSDRPSVCRSKAGDPDRVWTGFPCLKDVWTVRMESFYASYLRICDWPGIPPASSVF